MITEDYSFVADALLSLCAKEYQAPFYTEPQFERLVRTERSEPLYEQLSVLSGPDDLLREECRQILHRANLTERQMKVFRLRMLGLRFESIGRHCGHTRQGAQRVFLQAIKKIRHSYHVYPLTGLSDTYRRELRRGQLG